MSTKIKQRRKFRIVLFSTLVLALSGTISYASIQMNPFKFNLKFGTEDDNNQSAGSRLNFGYTEYSEYLTASVGLSTKINTYTNFNCRLLYKDPVSSGLTTATNNGTQSSSSSSIITLYYKSDYIQKFGYYNLYGWCTKGDCQAEGYWTP